MKALVIGGGIIGAAVAWRLACERVAVAVLERGRLGQEASWAAGGLIAPQGEADRPGPFFDLCMKAKQAFDALVERLVRESGVDPEYDEYGVLYVAFNEEEREELKARARWQREANAVVEELDAREALRLVPSLSRAVLHALHMPTNRRLDNRKLTQAYVNAAVRAGAEFREGACVDALVTSGGRASGVRLRDGSVAEADLVIIAAGAWSGEIRGLEGDSIRFFPVRGQILCFDARPGILAPSLFSTRGILVPRRDGRLLAGSVFEDAGYNKSVTLGGIRHVAQAACELMPALSQVAFREAWAGLRPATDDLMPVIGPSPTVSNVLYASGHFRSGIMLSALTGEVIADLAMGRKPVVDLGPFLPERYRSPVPRQRFKITEV